MASATVEAAVSAEEALVGQGEPVARWSLPAKVAFRFSFLYLTLYMFLNGNVTVFTILEPFPKVEGWIARQLFTPLATVTQWWAVRVFHLTGMAATWHHDGSGDTLLNYCYARHFWG